MGWVEGGAVYLIALLVWLLGWACHALWVGDTREARREAYLEGRRAEWVACSRAGRWGR